MANHILIPFVLIRAAASPDAATLSLHDALPICLRQAVLRRSGQHLERRLRVLADRELLDRGRRADRAAQGREPDRQRPRGDRKSTRLNSSHSQISYAVFCLNKTMAAAGRPDGLE